MERSESLGYLVSHLNVSLQNELNERLRRYDLDIKVWPVLFSLWQEEGITQTELSKRCDVASYTMTRLLDQMQSQQLITRFQEADNRRAFKIFLTDHAKALEQDVVREAERINEKFFSVLNAEERAEFMKLLNKINRLEG
ncbi:MarR family transcriptional regulator [Shewanella sp. NFH-SH190041]|uniref:MarR family winged helix-turn-helix transcriptional regulator n=1 Tax=Shewanella sp. NFH-SH190041 TaxID=2950245 RepID=UPI0021C25CCB|nr:MarR family transcriptional regulator [Shewanella sp. NFH-SH190041]BDM64941.1 MarR family transcriptional regulator [Shewanella sp. NFH-SH190041]